MNKVWKMESEACIKLLTWIKFINKSINKLLSN